MIPETESRLSKILTRLRETPPTDPKYASLMGALEEELSLMERHQIEKDQQLAEFAEAYEKLTSPANRLGIFLKMHGDETALIALGDTEYIAKLDPKLEDRDAIVCGVRVMLNEAYAVIGVMPQHEGGSIVKVTEILEDGRIRIGGEAGAPSRIILRSSGLESSDIKKGDEVRVEPMGRAAVEHFGHEDTRDYFVEDIQPVSWSQVGGQEAAIRVIRDTIEKPLLHPEIYAKFDKKPVKGILLYGPPGCGKTLIGKATAYNLAKEFSEKRGHEVKECFLHISGPKILNMWLGETERMVREIFEVARNKAKDGQLVVIFIDEAESILRTRSSGRWLNISNTVVPQFCAEMDGILGLDNVVVILTSNRPDYIDPAILRPERIDRKVKISRPDFDSSKQIMGIYLHETMPIDSELVAKNDGEESCGRKELIEASMAHLWRKTKDAEFVQVHLKNGSTETLYFKDMVSGALIKSVVDRAKEHAIERAISDPAKPQGLKIEDMQAAIDAEFRENEIFPKSDVMEDWLKLIDLEPESVASVKPIRPNKGEEFMRKNII